MDELLQSILAPLEHAPVECDGFTRIAWRRLHAQGIACTAYVGRLTGNDRALPMIHYWLKLEDGRLVDYRARYWLGDDPIVPHGVFHPGEFPEWAYEGKRVELEPLSQFVEEIMLIDVRSLAVLAQ